MLKSTWMAGVVATLTTASTPAFAYDYEWTGVFESPETNFVTVKRVEITKEKNGSLKVQGALVGFPNEVSIGEAIAEPYTDRNQKGINPNTLLARLSSDKYKPLIIMQPNTASIPAGKNIVNSLSYTCYFVDVDGRPVHINGQLKRRP